MTTIRRIIASYLLLLFLPRLDCPLVVAGWEWLDIGNIYFYMAFHYLIPIGYASYLSYVQVEAAYTNPVMNVFVNLMMAEIEGKSCRKSFQSSCKFILCPSM